MRLSSALLRTQPQAIKKPFEFPQKQNSKGLIISTWAVNHYSNVRII